MKLLDKSYATGRAFHRTHPITVKSDQHAERGNAFVVAVLSDTDGDGEIHFSSEGRRFSGIGVRLADIDGKSVSVTFSKAEFAAFIRVAAAICKEH